MPPDYASTEPSHYCEICFLAPLSEWQCVQVERWLRRKRFDSGEECGTLRPTDERRL